MPSLSKSSLRAASTALLALAATFSAAATSPATESTSRVQSEASSAIDGALSDLNSPKFSTREAATRELLNRGSSIIPQLEQILPTVKGETRYRIRSILEKHRRSADAMTRHSAEQALLRIAASRDIKSAAWARSLIAPHARPTPEPVVSQDPDNQNG